MNFFVKERVNDITLVVLTLLIVISISACGISRAATGPTLVIQAYFEALGSGDVEGAQALVAENATFNILGEVITGKEQIREYNQEAVLDNPSFKLSNFQVEGDEVTYTNTVTIGSQVFILSSEAVVQDGKIVWIVDK